VADIDVLIPTYGRPEIVNNTLAMLLDQELLPRRVVVVNQTPGVDAPLPEIRQAYKDANIELIWINREAANVMAAQNSALLAARSNICLIIDDDIIPPKDLIRKHWERHHDGENWVAVGGQVWHRQPDTEIQSLSHEKPSQGTFAGFMSDALVCGGPLFGGNWSFRRESVLDLGGWDEAFVGSANWQEGDMINRFKRHGYRFVWDPDIWVIHLRVPFGGCRIPGTALFPEWTKTTNFFLYKYRYPEEKSWKEVVLSALRAGPLRREIVVSPWRWPGAWFGFLKGWQLGKKKACNPVMPLLGRAKITGGTL